MNVEQQMHESDSTQATQGSSEQWNDIWNKYSDDDSGMKKLFTRGETKTIYQFWQRCYFEDFIELIGSRKDGKFLELGSGRGTTSLYLADAGIEDITLLDLSEKALTQAVANFQLEEVSAPKTVIANAEDTGLASNSFDFIYNIGVLEHFVDPGPFLKETCRLLKPGGVVFMPIVPKMPYYKSLTCRALLNPLSIAKQMIKRAVGRQQRHNQKKMVRTETGRKAYELISSSVGFAEPQCIPYNPYWKINKDNGFVFDFFALPAYKLHRNIKKSLGFQLSLKTLDCTCCCYLLTASK